MPTIDVNDYSIHYLDDGPTDGDEPRGTILMLHGFARNGWFWHGWLPRLATRHRVLRPDLRGCGNNPDPGADFVFRIDDVVADQIGLLDALGLDTVHLVGESTGGLAAGFIAARHPKRVLSLTLVSTPVTAANANSTALSPGADSALDSLRTLGLKRWWLQSRALSNDLFGDDRDDLHADEFALTPLHVAQTMWEEMHRPEISLEPYLGDIRAPVLLLTPEASHNMSATDQQALVAGLPDARQKIYTGAPHGIYYLRADELAAETIAFIDPS